jgi:hypothetical protein
VRYALSNSFGFGGNNCSLVFGKAQPEQHEQHEHHLVPTPPTLYIEGPAFWTPTLPGWDAARAAFRGEGALSDPPAKRPAPQVLAPAERRRAPDTVALALEVAAAAMSASGRNAADVPCVFTSAHGDLSINDYMCGTLATDPKVLSPTKFHNSVHNAAVGYWTIGTGCMAASNAISAYEHSFAAGLLEAAVQCAADQEAVLLVGYDTPTVGALTSVTDSRGLLAVALVLAPAPTERTVATLTWSLVGSAQAATAPRRRAPMRRSRWPASTRWPTRWGCTSRWRSSMRARTRASICPCPPRCPFGFRSNPPNQSPGADPMTDTALDSFDAVIMGGGLAGLTLALQLRQRFADLRVLVLERRAHPVPHAAHKVGESSVEIGAHYFDTVLGLKAHMDERSCASSAFASSSAKGVATSTRSPRSARAATCRCPATRSTAASSRTSWPRRPPGRACASSTAHWCAAST